MEMWTAQDLAKEFEYSSASEDFMEWRALVGIETETGSENMVSTERVQDVLWGLG